MAAPDLRQRLVDALPVDAVRFQDFGGKPLRLHNRGDEQMLGADEIVVETRHFRPGVFEQPLRPGRGVNLIGFVGQYGRGFQSLAQGAAEDVGRSAQFGQNPRRHAVIQLQ